MTLAVHNNKNLNQQNIKVVQVQTVTTPFANKSQTWIKTSYNDHCQQITTIWHRKWGNSPDGVLCKKEKKLCYQPTLVLKKKAGNSVKMTDIKKHKILINH